MSKSDKEYVKKIEPLIAVARLVIDLSELDLTNTANVFVVITQLHNIAEIAKIGLQNIKEE